MEVRSARPEEYDTIGRLTVTAYAGLGAGDEWRMHLDNTYASHLRAVADRAQDTEVLVAIEDEEVVGAVTYVPSSRSRSAEFDDDDAAGIRMLAVAPRAQGRGIGATLVEACIQKARETGRARVVLHTQSFMYAATELYRSFGFERRVDLDFAPAPSIHLEGYALELGTARPGSVRSDLTE